MEDKKRAMEAEERVAYDAADKKRIARDEEPEVEGHRYYVGPERVADPSKVSKAS